MWTCPLSGDTVAAKMLLDQGFTNVVNLRSGIGEWQAKKLPIEN